MKRSSKVLSPVISLLSSSPSASLRVQEVFRALFSLQPLSLTSEKGDALDQTLRSKIPGLDRTWESLASQCPSSGAIVHVLSVSKDHSTIFPDNKDGRLSLVAISRGPPHGGFETNEAVQHSRDILASEIKSRTKMETLKLTMLGAMGRPIDALHILDGGLPLMELQQTQEIMSEGTKYARTEGLKEVSIPHYDDAKYKNGSSLLSRLSHSGLSRPVIGIYDWQGVAFRPLPAATADRSLPPPSLVFRCDNLDRAAEELTKAGAVMARIGYTGTGKRGQLIVKHKDINGLDIRFCEAQDSSSCFAEAQDALFASSLEELQNVNVMQEGGKDGEVKAQTDSRNGVGDCWVEFRANLMRPAGFMKRRNGSGGDQHRIARAPAIPYE